MGKGEKKWLPLESNPEMMTGFLRSLGLPPSFAFHDVYGLDADLLGMVPEPSLALLLLFPLGSEKKDAARIASSGADGSGPADLWYVKQTVGNACGTIGLLHAVTNSAAMLGLSGGGGGGGDETSYLARFVAKTAGMSAEERAACLEEDEELEAAHAAAAHQGDTDVGDLDTDVDLHFVCFVPGSDGHVWELDGRKKGPVKHAKVDDSKGFLASCAPTVQQFMEEHGSSGSVNFNLIALAPSLD